MNEIPLSAGTAPGSGLIRGDFRMLIRPNVNRPQSPAQFLERRAS
jgi:hypothetical protein